MHHDTGTRTEQHRLHDSRKATKPLCGHGHTTSRAHHQAPPTDTEVAPNRIALHTVNHLGQFTLTAQLLAPLLQSPGAHVFKAKAPRFKEQRDFDRILPHLDRAARSWLASALEQAHPGHAWHERLQGRRRAGG